jgi:hypothetical protein
MAQHIALKSINEHVLSRRSPFASLKQEALLFDQIGVLSLSTILDMCYLSDGAQRIAESISLSREQFMEADWLIKNGVIFDAKLSLHSDIKVNAVDNAEEYLSLLNLHRASSERMIKAFLTASKNMSEANKKERIHESLASQAVILRLIGIEMEASGETIAVPLLSYSDYVKDLPKTRKADVIRVIIKNLPMPDDMTSWEQILDFRKDEQNQKNLLNLRRWIRKISSENLTRAELDDELQGLINDFQHQMKIHKMKANSMVLETFVTTTLSFFESLVTLNLSKVAESIFALENRELALMDAEWNSPGREIAYLVKAREAFTKE